MSVANKYERAFDFQPTCKLWLFCNRKPRVTDDTVAFWSRVLLLPFVVSFAGRENHTLRPKLTQDPTHQAAVLAWIVRGAVRYLSSGLGKRPEAVIEATKAYRDDQDVLGPFLEQACALDAIGRNRRQRSLRALLQLGGPAAPGHQRTADRHDVWPDPRR